MTHMTLSIINIGREVLEAVIGAMDLVVEMIKDCMRRAIEWHWRRMVVDPSYAKTLLIIGKALVSIFVPRALVAAAVIALLADLLGTYSLEYEQSDDYADWPEFDKSDPYWT